MSRLQEQAEKWRYQCIKLKYENDKLRKQLLLAVSQNYCTICGNTLDGYKPKGGI